MYLPETEPLSQTVDDWREADALVSGASCDGTDIHEVTVHDEHAETSHVSVGICVEVEETQADVAALAVADRLERLARELRRVAYVEQGKRLSGAA